MLNVEYTNQFKKDLKLAKRRGKDLNLLHAIMEQIVQKKCLNSRLRDHVLSGNWNLHRELHIENDWLLIYRVVLSEDVVIFVRTGTHADLF